MVFPSVLKKIFGADKPDAPVLHPSSETGSIATAPPRTSPAAKQSPRNRISVQREEILDTRGRLCGYRFAAIVEETGKETPWAGADIGPMLVEAGVARIAERRLVIIPVAPSVFATDLPAEIATPNTVLVINSGQITADNVTQLCEAAVRVRAAGVKIGLDGLIGNEALGEFGRCVDWRFADLRTTPLLSAEKLARGLGAGGTSLGVRGVASWAERDALRACGFGYFLGPFLTTDVALQKDGSIDPGRLRLIDILNKLRADEDLHEVAMSLKLDPGLIVQLLAHANSPAAGLTQKIVTIEQAIMVMGREHLYRWLTALLFTAGKGSEGDRALLEKALARGRFMELVGEERLSKPQCDELFLAGLFTHLEALMKLPIQRIVEKMVLADDVKRLLLRNEGPYAAYLMLAIAIERGQPLAAFLQRIDVLSEDVNRRRGFAIEWAIEALQSA
jgi:EAL and modified HD-GYP domain-containing signal transduction protein